MKETVDKFVRLLWPENQDGCFTLWRVSDGLSRHIPLEERDVIAEVADSWCRARRDVYYGFGLRSADANLDQATQGSTRHIVGFPGIFLDIDFRGPTGAHNASAALPADVYAAARLLEEAVASPSRVVPGEPTAVVLTGYGIHVYYLLDKPYMWQSGDGGHERVRILIKKFQKGFIDFAAERGLHVDDIATIPRVLRLPGSSNWKVPSSPVEVEIIDSEGPRYTFADLEASVNLGPTRRMGRPPRRSESLPAPLAFRPEDGAPPWWETVQKRCQSIKDDDNKALIAKVYAGLSFAERGDRDNAMNRAAAILAFTAINVKFDVHENELAEVFRPSLAVWANEPGATKTLEEEIQKVRSKLSKHLEDARAAKAREAAQEEELLAGLLRATRPTPRASLAQVQGADGDDLKEEDGEEALSDELIRFSIIIHQTVYFLYYKGTYVGPVHEKEFDVAVRDAFADSPLTWFYEDEAGDQARKSMKQFLYDYATRAEGVVYDITIEKSYFNPKTLKLHVASAPMRDLTPTFCEEVDNWLRLLGGGLADKLLDWIATIGTLNRQSCALYLSGAPGTGKSFLSHGLSRLWKPDGGPTELSQVLSNFNSDLLDCPLVVADEALPRGTTTTALRDLIGESAFTITKKYVPNASLKGAIRMMLIANNDDLLATDEHLSANDLQAVASRFLHINTTDAARSFLESVDTARWLDDDAIAKHALWLMKNRKVVAGRRFLVTGQETEMLRKLVLRQASVKLVLEWMVRFLDSPTVSQVQVNNIIYGEKQFLITPSTVSQHWKTYIESARTPSIARITGALDAVSHAEKVRIGDVDFWSVNPGFIYDAAADFGNIRLIERVLEASPKVMRVKAKLSVVPAKDEEPKKE